MYTFHLILTTRPEYFSIQRYSLVCVKEISCLLPGATKISRYYCKKFLLQIIKIVKSEARGTETSLEQDLYPYRKVLGHLAVYESLTVLST
jgi:hypothetical protein